jgi:hypothetical protein
MAPIQLTQAEAEEILECAMLSQGLSFENFEPPLRLNAVVGLMVAVTSMQKLGWRVARPLIDAEFNQ